MIRRQALSLVIAIIAFLAVTPTWAAPVSLELLSNAARSPEAKVLFERAFRNTYVRQALFHFFSETGLNNREFLEAANSVEGARAAWSKAMTLAETNSSLAAEAREVAGKLCLDQLVTHIRAQAALAAAGKDIAPFQYRVPFPRVDGAQRIKWELSGERDEAYYVWYRAINERMEVAYRDHDLAEVRELLQEGADPNFRVGNDTLFTLAANSVETEEDREFVKLLLEDPRTDRNYAANYADSPLTGPVQKDQTQLVADLLLGGVSPYVGSIERGLHRDTHGYNFARSDAGTGETRRLIESALRWKRHDWNSHDGIIQGLANLYVESIEAKERGDEQLFRVIDAIGAAAHAHQRLPIIGIKLPVGSGR